jgi:hypothetical protein
MISRLSRHVLAQALGLTKSLVAARMAMPLSASIIASESLA